MLLAKVPLNNEIDVCECCVGRGAQQEGCQSCCWAGMRGEKLLYSELPSRHDGNLAFKASIDQIPSRRENKSSSSHSDIPHQMGNQLPIQRKINGAHGFSPYLRKVQGQMNCSTATTLHQLVSFKVVSKEPKAFQVISLVHASSAGASGNRRDISRVACTTSSASTRSGSSYGNQGQGSPCFHWRGGGVANKSQEALKSGTSKLYLLNVCTDPTAIIVMNRPSAPNK